ncbi:MAG TPA: DUF732 domain-containing protein [Acidimicrobiales bacterium]|nr:DUF732 domain-containing protein [Acidimicrobiales bacterium]
MGFLAWTAGALLTLGVAAGASAVVPQLINADQAPAVTNAHVEVAVEAPVAEAAAPAPAPAPEAVAVVAEVVPEAEEVVVAAPRNAPAPKAAPVAAVIEAPAPPPPPPQPVLAPRTIPSAAQVDAVIAGMKSQIPLLALVSVTRAQVDDIGNQVCTAFDQGQSFSQVKANGLSQVPAIVTVPPATVDYAVRQAVSMYCPAYASKLV